VNASAQPIRAHLRSKERAGQSSARPVAQPRRVLPSDYEFLAAGVKPASA